jgi:hypothetical protein
VDFVPLVIHKAHAYIHDAAGSTTPDLLPAVAKDKLLVMVWLGACTNHQKHSSVKRRSAAARGQLSWVASDGQLSYAQPP